MAKYAELYFAENEEDIPINKHIMKLPEGLRYRIIKWDRMLKYQEKSTWDIKGEKIQLPLTYTMYRKMPRDIRDGVFNKIEVKLKQKEITHLTLPRLITTSQFRNIKECTGNYIKPFFVMEVIKFATSQKIINKDLGNIEVILLDGNREDVDMIIDFIYPHINHLTIVSDRPERFNDKSQYIFQDVGLNMQVLSYNKNAISQGDIIIDTHYYDPSIIHLCKKGALYLDIANNKEKTVILMEKQDTINVIDQFLLVKNGEIVSTKKAEMLLEIDSIFTSDYKETMKRLQKQNIEIYKLV
ncbi:MAG: hypothetical protein GX366_06405 [Epulopiscium sp.]|nr:hypothetical protein [Candidatus Epulonipiscium sp.]